MKRTILVTAAVLSHFTACGAVWAEDSLFSRTPINSVFAQPGSNLPSGSAGPASPTGRPPAKLSGAPALAEVVSQAGLDPKAVSQNVVSTKVQHESWSFPALVTTSDDHDQVVLVLLLSVVQDEKQLPAAKLLEMMNANRDHAPAFFAYSSKRKRIELYRTLENSGVTPAQVREEIERLAKIAGATQSLWKLETSAEKRAPAASTPANKPAGEPAKTATKPPPARAATGQNPLVGRWSAARSKTEAFAMELKADGTFVLVHVNQGKQTRSTGKFVFSGNQLTLSGDDGSKLAGTVALQSAGEFQFQPSGGKQARLTFKKAS